MIKRAHTQTDTHTTAVHNQSMGARLIISEFCIYLYAACCHSIPEMQGRNGTGSPGQRFWPGRVGSRVSMSDPVFDPVLSLTCAFIVALFLQSNTISAN